MFHPSAKGVPTARGCLPAPWSGPFCGRDLWHRPQAACIFSWFPVRPVVAQVGTLPHYTLCSPQLDTGPHSYPEPTRPSFVASRRILRAAVTHNPLGDRHAALLRELTRNLLPSVIVSHEVLVRFQQGGVCPESYAAPGAESPSTSMTYKA